MKVFLPALAFFITSNLFAATQADLLRPSEAFQLSTEVVDGENLRATWDIKEGYYLYLDKINFSCTNDENVIREFTKPDGKKKSDPTFGDVFIYRDSVSFDLPIDRNSIEATTLSLLSRSQGCADIGICFPPQKQTNEITLPALPDDMMAIQVSDNNTLNSNPLAQDLGISSISGIGDITGIGGSANEPLSPDEAFKFDLFAYDNQTLNALWNITPGHYLYQHKIKFSVADATPDVKLGTPDLPKGKAYKDVYFGDVVTYEEDFEARIPVMGYQKSLTVIAEYQGCSKITGICYPSQTKEIEVDFSKFAPPVQNNTATESETEPALAPEKAIPAEPVTSITKGTTEAISPPQTEQSILSDTLKNKGILAIIGAFFIGGLLLTFTPCVFPMIPILSGIITGQGKDISRSKSIALSLAYVIPMALTYAVAGIIAGYTGANLSAALQNPWVLSIFALLFVGYSGCFSFK